MAQISTTSGAGVLTPLTTAADELVLPLQGAGPKGPDGCAAFTGGSGSVVFATAVVSIQGRLNNSTAKWKKLAVIDRGDNSTKSGNIALTDDTPFDFFLPNAAMYSDVKLVLESIGSGKVVADIETCPASFAPIILMTPPVAVATSAQLVNVSSATAFTVGPNGATNPTLNVVTNVSNEATGISLIGAAAGSRMVMTVLSSGTDEGLSINAKGAGTILLNPTGTGIVTSPRGYISTGAALGIGYGVGAGAAVSQATDRTTGVTCTGMCGAITTQATSLAAGATVQFTVTNTSVAVGDVVVCSIRSGPTNTTTSAQVVTVAAGSFKIALVNHHASVADTGAAIINFAVFKAVSS